MLLLQYANEIIAMSCTCIRSPFCTRYRTRPISPQQLSDSMSPSSLASDPSRQRKEQRKTGSLHDFVNDSRGGKAKIFLSLF